MMEKDYVVYVALGRLKGFRYTAANDAEARAIGKACYDQLLAQHGPTIMLPDSILGHKLHDAEESVYDHATVFEKTGSITSRQVGKPVAQREKQVTRQCP